VEVDRAAVGRLGAHQDLTFSDRPQAGIAELTLSVARPERADHLSREDAERLEALAIRRGTNLAALVEEVLEGFLKKK
jgi:hypothetical protein